MDINRLKELAGQQINEELDLHDQLEEIVSSLISNRGDAQEVYNTLVEFTKAFKADLDAGMWD